MCPMRSEEIYKAAEEVRSAIERADRASLPITFENFPRGSCGDATLILGTHLKSLGFGPFNYVVGDRGNQCEGTWHSHAWLEGEGLVIDITADQFPEFPHKVFVAPTSSFHETFDSEATHEADFHIYDQHTVATLSAAYSTILRAAGGT